VHRDIKPENLFLTSEGVLKVLDFGIARLHEATAPGGATRTGRMIGTPAFMPPEQALGRSRQVDAQTDLWAVGATMFTLMSGQFVHEAETMEEMLVHAGSRPARSLAAVAPTVPTSVAAVVDRALAFKIEDRWPDAAAMKTALTRAIAIASGGDHGEPGARTGAEVDPYALTAAAGVPPTVPWSPPSRFGGGLSTTAGMARSAAEPDQPMPAVSQWRAQAPRILAVLVGGILLSGTATFAWLRVHSGAGQDEATSRVLEAPSAPGVPAPAAALVTQAVAVEPAAASASPAPPDAPSASASVRASSMAAIPSVHSHPAQRPHETNARPPMNVAAMVPPAVPSEAVWTPGPPPGLAVAQTPQPIAPPAPTCRAVAYFDSDGFKRFRQECR
jgi:serine/threonine-protein kinase